MLAEHCMRDVSRRERSNDSFKISKIRDNIHIANKYFYIFYLYLNEIVLRHQR